jgi:RHS repeat-associated protein
MGRRISKTVGTSTPTQYLYSGLNAVQETQGSAINPILVGLDTDERFARNDVTGRTYFLTDALNSTIALTDPTGAIKEQYSYDPYGNVTPSDTTTGFTNPYQFMGREADTPGLYYYRARYYSPMMAGFISEDPAGFAGGQLSFYSGFRGDPLDFNDPLGLAPKDKWFGYTNKNFQWWLHNCYKRSGDPDVASKAEMAEIYAEYLAAGSPPMGKCNNNKPCQDEEEKSPKVVVPVPNPVIAPAAEDDEVVEELVAEGLELLFAD